MSYDFLIMKPRAGIAAEIESLDDLGEHTLLRQEPGSLVEALSSLFPALAWRNESDGGWLGSLQDDYTWYELRIGAAADYAWSVNTSQRATTRKVIPTICDRLGLLAFDGQANLLIWPAGYR
jgi:hypothetical protein